MPFVFHPITTRFAVVMMDKMISGHISVTAMSVRIPRASKQYRIVPRTFVYVRLTAINDIYDWLVNLLYLVSSAQKCFWFNRKKKCRCKRSRIWKYRYIKACVKTAISSLSIFHFSSVFASTFPLQITSKDTLCSLLWTSLDRVLLSGSAELTTSKFRHCPAVRGRRRRLPIWAWVLIAVGGAILALILFGTIIAVVRKSKKNGTPKKKSFPEPRKPGDKRKDLWSFEWMLTALFLAPGTPTIRTDPAAEPVRRKNVNCNSSTVESRLDACSRLSDSFWRYGLFTTSRLWSSSTTRTACHGQFYQCLISTPWTWLLRSVWFDFSSFFYSMKKKKPSSKERRRKSSEAR